MTDVLPPTRPTAVSRLAAQVEWTDSEAAAQARRHTPRGFGRLVPVVEWLAETQGHWPPRPPRAAWLLTPRPPSALVRDVAAECAVQVEELALPDSTEACVDAGGSAADARIDDGADLLLVATGRSPGIDVAAGVLVGLYSGAEPVALLPRGADAVDTTGWIARAQQLRDARREAAGLRGAPDELLVTAGSGEIAAAVGVILRAAARRVPVVVDGAGAAGAALLCQDVAPRSARWCRIADTSPDPLQARAADDIGALPLTDLGTRGGDGNAAVTCVPVLRAVAVMAAALADPTETAAADDGEADRP